MRILRSIANAIEYVVIKICQLYFFLVTFFVLRLIDYNYFVTEKLNIEVHGVINRCLELLRSLGMLT